MTEHVHNNSEQGFLRRLSSISGIVAIVGLIFTAGYNWRRIDELTVKQEMHEKMAEGTFLRGDVSQQQYANVLQQLEQLRREVNELKQLLEQRRGRDPGSTR